MPTILYGIPNCDSVKKARAWLTAHGIEAQFHDFRKAGVPEQRLDAWLHAVGWERLLNRRGTTWRGLDASVRDGVVDSTSARRAMLAQPSVIKRPVIEWAEGAITVGLDPGHWPPTG